MATNVEKQALGLGPEATEDDVKSKIAELRAAAESSGGGDSERVAELEAELAEAKKRLDKSATATSRNLSPKEDGERHEVTIKIRAFPYYEDEEDLVSGVIVRREKIAVRGQTVKLGKVDFHRAQKFDAIYTDDEENPRDAAEDTAEKVDTGQVSFRDATVEDLSTWIQVKQPSSDRILEEANNDPELARKLLDAEEHATGGEPRDEVEDGLTEIIDGE